MTCPEYSVWLEPPWKETTGQSPFGLVYENEALLPIEVGIPSFRMTFYEFEKNEEEKPIKLDLLPETRGNALLTSIRCKQRVTRLFNRRVKAIPIQLGDWVVRKVEATGLSHLKGKLGTNWDGTYKVSEVIKLGIFWLESPEGIPLARPWNADNLKNFYV